MKAIDTNLLVRVITKDDPVQTRLAQATLEGSVFVPHSVILETEWVLRSRYDWARHRIAIDLRELLDVGTVNVVEPELLRWAIHRYEEGADLADMLHIVASVGREAFVSFDVGLAGEAGPDTPILIEQPS